MNQFENLLQGFQSWEAPQAATALQKHLWGGSRVPPSQSVEFSEKFDWSKNKGNVTLQATEMNYQENEFQPTLRLHSAYFQVSHGHWSIR